jgi:branched-subunit amino acid aminotransferase/4-amino-4-deoxychorismate lyase
MITTYKDFTDRETYLVARAAWRADYKALSQAIRDAKVEIKTVQREKGSGYASSEQWRREAKRREATQLLKIRAEMKIKSGEQRAAMLAEKVAA